MRAASIFFLAMTILPLLAAPGITDLDRMSARLKPVTLHASFAGLDEGDRRALGKVVEAARVLDRIFLEQMWSGNLALYDALEQDHSALGKARLRAFWLNKGPWSELDGYTAFLPGVPEHRPAGANFYPEDMTKREFEAWTRRLKPEARAEATGFFTVIRRKETGMEAVPYSTAYHDDLARCAGLLREAAHLTLNASLKRFLELRAAAFLDNNYYESDLAWMDIDAPIDITIGPYETYNDELFGYKASFEAYVNLRDDAETARLQVLGSRLQAVEDRLPIEARYRNPKIAAQAPIRVVNEVFASGDADHGVKTAAYNLPNDERVVAEKGSKRVMLKNVQEAKFEATLDPLARRVLAAPDELSFDAFFTHILAHELSHGIGPRQIRVRGRETTPRKELKEMYSAIEEAKADITGLFMLGYFYDAGILPGGEKAKRRLYTTFLASSFRTLRFGLKEAHARGMALQFHALEAQGAFVHRADGRWEVNFARMDGAVREVCHDLLTIEAQGDYAAAARRLAGGAAPDVGLERTLESLRDLPVDIDPAFPELPAEAAK